MSTRFFKAMGKGGEEWEGKGKAIIEITEALEVTAKDLERSLYPITPFPSHFHPTFPTSLLHLPDFSHWGVGEGGEQEWEKDGWGHGWWEEGNDIVEENDPYLLKSRFRRVHEAVEKWKMSMRMGVCSTPPTFFSRRWRDSLKGVFLPWFQACFQVWIDLFYNVPSYLFSKKFYWRYFFLFPSLFFLSSLLFVLVYSFGLLSECLAYIPVLTFRHSALLVLILSFFLSFFQVV